MCAWLPRAGRRAGRNSGRRQGSAAPKGLLIAGLGGRGRVKADLGLRGCLQKAGYTNWTGLQGGFEIPIRARHPPRERSENVAFGARRCAFMQVSSEGGPANLLKTQNLEIHQRAYEPEGQEFESLRAHITIYSIIVIRKINTVLGITIDSHKASQNNML